MPEQTHRAALYVDFDNVFMALLRWDERAAYAFGERPDAWLAWLQREDDDNPRRRILVRRCYLNPGRYVDFPTSGPVAAYRATLDRRNRLFFSEFRASFVEAGFDVVDCPPIASLKNSADMKMALDIREALDHPTRFDEFILLSGDSDFLPALVRLRAHDRRITILAQDTAKQAYLAAADTVVGLSEFANDGMGALPIAAFEVKSPVRERVAAWWGPEAPQPALAAPARRADGPADLRPAVLAWLREALARVPSGAVMMTVMGDGLRRAFPGLKESNYAGAGTLQRLIEEARDPSLALHGPSHQRWLYDPARSAPPAPIRASEAEQPDIAAPPPEPRPPEPEEPPEDRKAEPATPDSGDSPVAMPEEIYAGLDTTPAAPEAPWPPEVPAEQPVLSEPAAPAPADAPPPPEPVAEAPRQTAAQPTPADPAARAAFMAETVARLRDTLWGRRDIKGFPLDLPEFSSAEVGGVLEGIARRSPFGPMQLEQAARDVAVEAARRQILVSPREVVAVIRWLLRGKAGFRDPMPATAALGLAEILYDQLGLAVERASAQRTTAPRPEERFGEEEWAALEAWLISEIRTG